MGFVGSFSISVPKRKWPGTDIVPNFISEDGTVKIPKTMLGTMFKRLKPALVAIKSTWHEYGMFRIENENFWYLSALWASYTHQESLISGFTDDGDNICMSYDMAMYLAKDLKSLYWQLWLRRYQGCFARIADIASECASYGVCIEQQELIE